MTETPDAAPASPAKRSPGPREELQRAMDALVHEAADILTRRTESGRWLAPGETGELGDNHSMARAAELWVLSRLDARIAAAREAAARVTAAAHAESGIAPREQRYGQ